MDFRSKRDASSGMKTAKIKGLTKFFGWNHVLRSIVRFTKHILEVLYPDPTGKNLTMACLLAYDITDPRRRRKVYSIHSLGAYIFLL